MQRMLPRIKMFDVIVKELIGICHYGIQDNLFQKERKYTKIC